MAERRKGREESKQRAQGVQRRGGGQRKDRNNMVVSKLKREELKSASCKRCPGPVIGPLQLFY